LAGFCTVGIDRDQVAANAERYMSTDRMTKVPHHAVVFVGDGRKALFLRNEGDEKFPNLKMAAVFEDENPAAGASE
jgi:hypothetical protein